MEYAMLAHPDGRAVQRTEAWDSLQAHLAWAERTAPRCADGRRYRWTGSKWAHPDAPRLSLRDAQALMNGTREVRVLADRLEREHWR
jgi:hypothetical protein